MTKSDEYKPTLAERKLLEVLINPDNVGKNVTELCNLAEVSRNKYYEAMKKTAFRDMVTQTTMDIIKSKMGDVINATYKYSLEERGHQDRKLLLTMAGLYTDKQETTHSGGIDIGTKSEVIQKYLQGDSDDSE